MTKSIDYTIPPLTTADLDLYTTSSDDCIIDASSLTMNASLNSYTFNTGANGTYSTMFTQPSGALSVHGDAEFQGDIKWKGRSLGDMLETIEKRLSILQPDPAKLEHFEALQKAYQHYKTLEALCELPTKEEE